ncbi:MAG TPA: hypothetical protein VMZ53_20030 [Kofleriaceae bacterium]|nr:hypothetical protein [Kofleriaceae bacterium]
MRFDATAIVTRVRVVIGAVARFAPLVARFVTSAVISPHWKID